METVRGIAWAAAAAAVVVSCAIAGRAVAAEAAADLKPPFAWTLSPPLVSPKDRADGPCVSVKDPTVVFAEGRWHVFMTVRRAAPPVHMEYVSFDRWDSAGKAPRHVFTWHDRYFCAPQVFYFRPHKKWYLVYQWGNPDRKLMQPAYATTEKIADPASWSPGHLFFPEVDPKDVSRWIDFWVICDEKRAYLFFTSLDGRMWRMWTPLEKFPEGFDHCELALKADIFEAAHTYRLAGQEKYLTVIEAQGKAGRRYYKAYTADRLDGAWQPLADTEDRPFAGAANVRQPDPPWADNISHGELLRAGCDETMTVDPGGLKFLIQGVNNNAKGDKGYGMIPWRLGLLTAAPAK
ncbi:MAG: glycoside hydrolase [Planctomycetes bacterium]|nr:glycoside hydrolase [Planctomycetota bacterium]